MTFRGHNMVPVWLWVKINKPIWVIINYTITKKPTVLPKVPIRTGFDP